MRLDGYQPVFNTSVKFKQAMRYSEEQVLAFFGEVTRRIPSLSDYRCVDKDHHLVERAAGDISRQILCGEDGITLAVAPPLKLSEARDTGGIVYSLISEHLRPNPLLIKHVEVSFRFGFPFTGNHDLLVLNELFGATPFAIIAHRTQGAVRDFQPTLRLSLTADHSIIAAIELQTSTSEREIQSGTFDGNEIKLVCGVGRVKNLTQGSLVDVFHGVFDSAVEFIENNVLDSLVEKLRDATTVCTSPGSVSHE